MAPEILPTHRRAGVRANAPVSEKLTTDVEHAELNLADRDEFAPAGRNFANFCEWMRSHKISCAGAPARTRPAVERLPDGDGDQQREPPCARD